MGGINIIRVDVKRTDFFNELSDSDRIKFFDFKSKKVINHIDTLYYTVSLKNDLKDSILKTYSKNIRVNNMIEFLKCAKDEMSDIHDEKWLYYDEQLVIKNRSFKLYNICLSRENYFDIFICSSLPNDKTPRIFVQLRSIGLWTLGEYELIKESFRVLKKLLDEFKVEVKDVYENRIDYAYHTNCIQNAEKYFSDKCLKENLITTFKKYQKVGDLERNRITIDYMSLGKRQSNNTFFRVYNKTKEVVNMNYKGFFIEFWYSEKLINFYDFFVLNYAYTKHNFNYIYEGMAKFYIKYGKHNYTKQKLISMIEDPNCTFENLKNYVLKFMPMITIVINIEFQTMRKFYYYSDSQINSLPINTECFEPVLLRLFQILDNRLLYHNYLTSVSVNFVKDNKVKESPSLDFWNRVRKIKLQKHYKGEFKRVYPMSKVDEKVIINKLKKELARLSIVKNNIDTDINEDMSLLFGVLNDNDIEINNDGILSILDNKYNKIKEKQRKKLNSIILQKEKENV